jgi:hypothetical protein
VEIDFGANEVCKIALYAGWKELDWSGSFVWPLGNRRSYYWRIAREHNSQEPNDQ